MRGENLLGQRFGRLTVIELIPKELRPNKTAKRGNHWKCQCDCGNIVIHYTGALKQGDINSCGCLQKETRIAKGIDEIGNRYGNLVVIQKATEQDYYRPTWICECDCGNIITVMGNRLRSGHTKSCGCLKLGDNPIMPGERFGLLTTITRASNTKDSHKRWVCRCDCGTITIVTASNLKKGNSKSCGCVRSWGEKTIAEFLTKNNIKFIKEYSFEDLHIINPLRFDFAIFDNNNNLISLIEYQGEQHYNTNNPYYKESIVKSDEMKREYCQKKSIKLYEIKYNEDLIEKLEQIFGCCRELNTCGNYKGGF